jgi:signal transduction histidine kinase
MPVTELHIDLVLVFFVYGLAFFSMGIALTLETGRSPLLAERQILRPLAIFGLLHGIHEWIEIIFLQGVWLGLPFPDQLSWLRVIWLAISFVPLVVFGLLVLRSQQRPATYYFFAIAALLVLFLALIVTNLLIYPEQGAGRVDALARYFLAVPGGLLACQALLARARQVKMENRAILARHFRWAAAGFGVYGLTQTFVSPLDMFPANLINAGLFLDLVGFPVQVVRAGMAVLVTTALIRATQVVETERQAQLVAVQQSRLEALEQVQRELVERETMRRELLRHTVIAQEEERARIARELHDETSQALTAFTLNLATLRQSVPRRTEVTALVDRLQSLSQQMSQGIYRMVHDLRPAQLDDLGLVPALQYLADETRQRLGLEVSIEVIGPRQRLDPLVETVIFRVAQEALANVRRHAGTNRATLQLSICPEQVILRVCDAGTGFDPQVVFSPPHGWGLAGMQERAESLGGRFQLTSKPGAGTTIEIQVPLERPPAPVDRHDHEEIVHGNNSVNVGR